MSAPKTNAPKMNGKKESRESHGPATLYVVFHGEIAFFDSGDPEDDILAYASEMDIHQYCAGEWLGENRIPKGLTLRLKGVTPGSQTFTNKQDVTATFGGATTTSHKRHMTILLPRPDDIFPGARDQIKATDIQVVGPGSIHIPTGSNPNDKFIALAVVFQYTVPAGAEIPHLAIIDGGVSPGFSPNWVANAAVDGIYVLHVYAEADCFPGIAHIQAATKEAAALLGIEVQVSINEFKPARESAPGRPGLTPQEINLTLADRTLCTGDLGVQFRKGDPCLYFRIPGSQAEGFGAGACGLCAGVPGNVGPAVSGKKP